MKKQHSLPYDSALVLGFPQPYSEPPSHFAQPQQFFMPQEVQGIPRFAQVHLQQLSESIALFDSAFS